MPQILLVACVSKKRKGPTRAADLYISTWFSRARDYAELTTLANSDDKWYILSAKHGLLSPHEVIEPYDTSLNKMKAAQRREWAKRVLSQLTEESVPATTSFIVLAGRSYRQPLVNWLCERGYSVAVPMVGLRIGQQLKWLSENRPVTT